MDLDYKNIMENFAGIAICAEEKSGKIIWLNKAAEGQTGIKLGDNISRVFTDTLDFKDFGQKYIQREREKYLIYKISDRWYAVDFTVDGANGFITVSGIDVTDMVSAGFVELRKSRDDVLGIYDRKSAVEFLDSFVGRVEEESMNLLTLAYIRLTDAPANVKESVAHYVKRFTGVVVNGIRGTDVFAFVEKMDFVILFPRCSFEVVENIITTIENKLNLLSASDQLDYEFEFDYSIMEIDKNNTADSETLLKRAENML